LRPGSGGRASCTRQSWFPSSDRSRTLAKTVLFIRNARLGRHQGGIETPSLRGHRADRFAQGRRLVRPHAWDGVPWSETMEIASASSSRKSGRTCATSNETLPCSRDGSPGRYRDGAASRSMMLVAASAEAQQCGTTAVPENPGIYRDDHRRRGPGGRRAERPSQLSLQPGLRSHGPPMDYWVLPKHFAGFCWSGYRDGRQRLHPIEPASVARCRWWLAPSTVVGVPAHASATGHQEWCIGLVSGVLAHAACAVLGRCQAVVHVNPVWSCRLRRMNLAGVS